MMIKSNKKQSESNLDFEFEIRGKGYRKKTISLKQLFGISSRRIMMIHILRPVLLKT